MLAAAIRAGAQLIVTDNIKHFPEEALQPFGVTAQGPDGFLAGLVESDGRQMVAIVDAILADLRQPDSREGLLARLRRNGLQQTASELEASLPAYGSSR